MDPAEFRRVLGHWATGVAVVAARDQGGHACALTANAFSSVSLEPALVLVCVEHTSETHGCIQATGAFAVSILAEHQERLARRFAESEVADKFAGVAWRSEHTGSPVLEDALAWVDCTVRHALPGGDHTIFVAEVVAADARDGTPLTFYRGGYGRFQP
ncbi:MAG: flavin reductase family protein [Gemmatimonadota bacterium]